MKIEYNIIPQVNKEIDIDNLGDVSIEATTKSGDKYYLVIRTYMGFTSIMEYGPITPDLNIFPRSVRCSFDRIEYSEGKIESRIDKFLNQGNRFIEEAIVIPEEEALMLCKDIVEYMKNQENY